VNLPLENSPFSSFGDFESTGTELWGNHKQNISVTFKQCH